MKKGLFRVITVLLILYVLVCVALYFFQEKLIFAPEKLNKDFNFSFNQPFEEVNFKVKDNILLNALLFKADSSKGLIFYLHGNAGSANAWGGVAKTYTDLQYDVLLLDYPGYGKSEGSISSEQQLFDDVQIVYDKMKSMYAEDKIIVLGYSLGTTQAARIASVNNPKLLILQAPLYNSADLMKHSNYFIFPSFILRYKFRIDQYIRNCKMPVIVFHGDKDETIYYNSSVKLKELFKRTDTLITLKGQGHVGITDNPVYKESIRQILTE